MTLDCSTSSNQNGFDLEVGKCGDIKRAVLKFQSPSADCTIGSAMMKLFYVQETVDPDRPLKVYRVSNETLCVHLNNYS